MRLLIRLLITLGLSLGLLLSASSLAPLAAATADPSPTAGPAQSDSQSDSPSASPSSIESSSTADDPSPSLDQPATAGSSKPSQDASTGQKSLSKLAASDAVSDPTLETTITGHPGQPSLDTSPTFTFEANRPGVQFRCTLQYSTSTPSVSECPADAVSSKVGVSTGSFTYTDRNPGSSLYTFTVQAYVPAVVTPVTPEVEGGEASFAWRLYSLRRQLDVVPSTGASFNNPLGTSTSERRNLTRVINAIKSMPGYAQPADTTAPCPALDSGLVPSSIRVTLYSMTDGRFARAMIDAARRCVSVQILMNNHLSSSTDPAWKTLVNTIGSNTAGRSFARRCSYGCRGSGVLHTKMYLFDSSVPAPLSSSNKINNTTMVGSSNMTQNAARVQWNDLYGVRGNSDLYRSYLTQFNLMKRDNGFHRNASDYYDGIYRSTFWPVASGRTEPYLASLRSISCTGANGGTGVNGRSVVYINMHAWFGLRGLAIAKQVRSMYAHGCYIKILYSFMTKRVHYNLTHGTGSRMQARRTIFSLNGDKYADVYSHFKNVLVSGHVGSDRSSRVVWTGSNNFTADGTHFDEVMMRIPSSTAFGQYRNQFNYIKGRKSSSRWASFLEPVGGGRAPKRSTIAQLGTNFAATDAPTILAPGAITTDAAGNPKALD